MDQGRIPKPGELYHHFKDKLYQIITVATHTETGESMVVYQALYGDFKTYVRPLSMFLGEVDKEKYPEAKQDFRFEIQEAVEDSDYKKQTTVDQVIEAETGSINAVLLKFLDAESYSKKLEVLTSNRKHMNDRLINDMAVALDCTVEEGPLDKRIDEIISCLQAMCRFEDRRLR